MAQTSMEAFLSPDSKVSRSVKLESKKRSLSEPDSPSRKKAKTAGPSDSNIQRGAKNARGDLGDIATAAELEEEKETPFHELERVVREGSKEPFEPKGNVVIYWMRMKDLRIADNKALANASATARSKKKTLIVIHVLSPNDFRAHRRAPRRIDFVLRNLKMLKADLNEICIPLYVFSVQPRKSLPEKVVAFAKEIQASHIYANIEYEVDELRQLTSVYKLAKEKGIQASFLHDYGVVQPGKVATKQGKPYSVWSPFYRSWSELLQSHPSDYLDEAPPPEANPESVYKEAKFRKLFDTPVPEFVEGFSIDEADHMRMDKWWPAGEKAAHACLSRFIQDKATDAADEDEEIVSRKQDTKPANLVKTQEHNPVLHTKEQDRKARSMISEYNKDRSRPDADGTSRLSPYLAAGVISIRACVRATLPFSKNRIQTEKSTAIGTWISEVSWRDFYCNILAAFPRVCMGKAFARKFDQVVWESNPDHIQAWKEGRTGFPLVDAGMRQLVDEGWMHNRARMCVAMFLTKDLLLDWRIGEEFFMQNLVDGDLAANNGGWQWCAGTGADPSPYFRVFNPTTQSEKSDPTAKYIRKYVPELRNVPDKAVHNPIKHLSKKEFEKTGYAKPLVDHAFARKRAIARFKNPGTDADQ